MTARLGRSALFVAILMPLIVLGGSLVHSRRAWAQGGEADELVRRPTRVSEVILPGWSELRSSPVIPRSELPPPSPAVPASGAAAGAADPNDPAYLAETSEVRFTPGLDELINFYHSDPLLLYEFVRGEKRFQAYYGAMKDAQHVLDTIGGNDFDQASLLIAAYRRMGIPARYVRGTIEIPIQRAKDWLGVDDAFAVDDILTAQAIPHTLIGFIFIDAVQVEHVWMEAFLDFSNYRGIPNGGGGGAWVPLDPSFQLLEQNAGGDLAVQSGFDPDLFLDSYLLAPTSLTAGEQYLEELKSFIAGNDPNDTLHSVLWRTDSAPERFFSAQGSLPFPTVQEIETTAAVPDNLRHKLRIQANGLDHTMSLVEVVGRRLTISYEAATPADQSVIDSFGTVYDVPSPQIGTLNLRPELLVDGQAVAVGTGLSAGTFDTQSLEFLFNGSPLGPTVSNTVFGVGRYAVGISAQAISSRIARERLAKFEEGFGTIGDPSFDSDDTLGEALFLHGMLYWSELARTEQLVARSMQMVPLQGLSAAIVGTDAKVFVSGPTVTNIDPGGVFIDVDRFSSLGLSIDGDLLQSRDFAFVVGATGSALEHLVMEALWDVETVSTVSIIQSANQLALPVFKIDAGNRATLVPQLTHTANVIASINGNLDQGLTVTVPRDPVTINSWSGTGWIARDEATGGAGYFINGGLSGGSMTETVPYVANLVATGEIALPDFLAWVLRAGSRIRLPVDGPISSRYERRIDPTDGKDRFHKGIDVKVPIGTEIKAPGFGVVVRSDRTTPINTGFGERIIINHGTDAQGNMVYTQYGHLKDGQTALIPEGTVVQEGEAFALTGNTGKTTGPHLHYEVKVIPPGGPGPFDAAFFEQGVFDPKLTVNPETFEWPDLTPPPVP